MTDRAQEDDKPFEVRLSDESFETYEMDPPSYELNTTKKELKQMYYDMVASRYVITVPKEEEDCDWKRVGYHLGRNTDLQDAGRSWANVSCFAAAWKWPPTVFTRRRRSVVSATCRLVRKLSLLVSNTLSSARTT